MSIMIGASQQESNHRLIGNDLAILNHEEK